MATINYIGLTGIKSSVTVTMGTDTFDSLITKIASDEGLPTDYYYVSQSQNPSINDTDVADSSANPTLTVAGLVDGDLVYCALREQDTKEQRQIQKLEIAQVKRKGGPATDTNAVYYRTNNTYDATSLPDTYNDNLPGPDDNPNTGGLIQKRPWVAASAVAEPQSIAESVGGDTLADLQIWYDGSDSVQFQPT